MVVSGCEAAVSDIAIFARRAARCIGPSGITCVSFVLMNRCLPVHADRYRYFGVEARGFRWYPIMAEQMAGTRLAMDEYWVGMRGAPACDLPRASSC